MNIQYIQDNFTSVYGTPFKIVRIPMIPSTSGGYPNGNWNGASYRTYANNLIVNKKVLVPTYRTQYDTTGLRILRESMPGYEVIGIDCDNSGANIIGSGGAIHCITKAIGVSDPLLISHQQLSNTTDNINPQNIEALIMHRSGILSATLNFKKETDSSFSSVSMTNISGNKWAGDIPAQAAGSSVKYYISAIANSGKTQVRPLTAPNGYFKYKILNFVDVPEVKIAFGRVFPNPSHGLTCIEINNSNGFNGALELYDIMGKKVSTIHSGKFIKGGRKYFIDLSNYAKGAYLFVLKNKEKIKTNTIFIN